MTIMHHIVVKAELEVLISEVSGNTCLVFCVRVLSHMYMSFSHTYSAVVVKI